MNHHDTYFWISFIPWRSYEYFSRQRYRGVQTFLEGLRQNYLMSPSSKISVARRIRWQNLNGRWMDGGRGLRANEIDAVACWCKKSFNYPSIWHSKHPRLQERRHCSAPLPKHKCLLTFLLIAYLSHGRRCKSAECLPYPSDRILVQNIPWCNASSV